MASRWLHKSSYSKLIFVDNVGRDYHVTRVDSPDFATEALFRKDQPKNDNRAISLSQTDPNDECNGGLEVPRLPRHPKPGRTLAQSIQTEICIQK